MVLGCYDTINPLNQEGIKKSNEACLETFVQGLAVQFPADEHQDALPDLPRLPLTVGLGLEYHVHALEHHALGLALDRDHTLHPENVRPLLGQQFRQPVVDLLPVHLALDFNADGFDRFVMHVVVLFVVMIMVMVAFPVLVVAVVVIVVMIPVLVIMIVTVGFPAEKLGLQFQDAVEVEAVYIQHLVQGNRGIPATVDLGQTVHRMDPGLQLVQLGRGDEVGLVQQDHIGERDLLLNLAAVVEMLFHMLGIDQRNHCVDFQHRLHFLVHEERLDHGTGIGQAGGLDEDAVEFVAALEQAVEDADEVAAHGAADAAVVHLKDFLVGVDHEFVVDADLAVFVLDDRDALAVVFREDAVEEGGFPGPEEAGEDGDGNGCGGAHVSWGGWKRGLRGIF